MNEMLSKAGIAYIVGRVLDNALDAAKEKELSPDDDFLSGKMLAYYEVLDTIKNELIARNEDLKEYHLDMMLERLVH